MQGSVAFVGEVGVLEFGGVVLDDSLHENEIVEVDGTAETDGSIDPGMFSITYVG